MTNFNVLLQKEFREAWRSRKFLWIPLVFTLLGMSEPLTNYYMMDILNAVGNLPEGFAMTMPELMPADLLQASIGQFQLIGLLVLIAAFVGSICKERANGMATLLYVRPISFAAYFMSKYVVMSVVGLVSIVAGFTASAYYTMILYGNFEVVSLLGSFVTYFVWLLMVLAITLLMSAAFKMGIATACAFMVIFGGQIIDAIVGMFWRVSPWKLPEYAVLLIRGTMDMKDYWWSVLLTIGLLLLCIIVGIYAMKKNTSIAKL